MAADSEGPERSTRSYCRGTNWHELAFGTFPFRHTHHRGRDTRENRCILLALVSAWAEVEAEAVRVGCLHNTHKLLCNTDRRVRLHNRNPFVHSFRPLKNTNASGGTLQGAGELASVLALEWALAMASASDLVVVVVVVVELGWE